jgi:hypothetical protein
MAMSARTPMTAPAIAPPETRLLLMAEEGAVEPGLLAGEEAPVKADEVEDVVILSEAGLVLGVLFGGGVVFVPDPVEDPEGMVSVGEVEREVSVAEVSGSVADWIGPPGISEVLGSAVCKEVKV